jgi:hypothetical protein
MRLKLKPIGASISIQAALRNLRKLEQMPLKACLQWPAAMDRHRESYDRSWFSINVMAAADAQ